MVLRCIDDKPKVPKNKLMLVELKTAIH